MTSFGHCSFSRLMSTFASYPLLEFSSERPCLHGFTARIRAVMVDFVIGRFAKVLCSHEICLAASTK